MHPDTVAAGRRRPPAALTAVLRAEHAYTKVATIGFTGEGVHHGETRDRVTDRHVVMHVV